MERKPYFFNEHFSGDWGLFKEVFGNPYTNVFYDVDGILLNLPKIVLRRFSERTGIEADPTLIDEWNYLTKLAAVNGASRELVETAENDYYDPDLIRMARKYLWIAPVVERTLEVFGADRNFILTSREPEFTDITFESLKKEFPKILSGNIHIRTDKKEKPTEFKAGKLKSRANHAPWVVLIEDSIKYVRAALDADIPNCLVVNVPLGQIRPDFFHKRLVVLGRYPREIQAMYPLWNAVEAATRNLHLVAQS